MKKLVIILWITLCPLVFLIPKIGVFAYNAYFVAVWVFTVYVSVKTVRG